MRYVILSERRRAHESECDGLIFNVNDENLRRQIDADNANRAVYWWRVKRWPGIRDDDLIDRAEVLIAEYDVFGVLHKLDEIKIAPPYIFELLSPRLTQGIKHRYVVIEPGFSHVWEHRVLESFSVVAKNVGLWNPRTGKQIIVETPDYQVPRMIDCAIYGHQHLKTGVTEVMLVAPDGSDHGPFFSLADARAFVK